MRAATRVGRWKSSKKSAPPPFRDDFNRPDGAVGNGWNRTVPASRTPSVWVVSNQRVRLADDGGGFQQFLTRPVGGTDYTVSVDVVVSSGLAGVAFRHSGGDSLFWFYLDAAGSYLLRRNGSNSLVYQDTTARTGTVRVSATTRGDGAFSVAVDGVQLYSGNDATLATATEAGLVMIGTAALADNAEIARL